ncbi:uncharacterized protein PFLUO_LOCUS2895 [Penicillium psychrofluorescens]|uniref:uncharacterized protein n=1 Tax=Penicillium psychrofluorescens TaxID=3158075 RepID=UPI003CCD122D
MTLARSISLCLFLFLASAQAAIVNLGYASYKGRSLSNGVSQWLGVRFAAAPVGPLRFAAPQDPPKQHGVQLANQHGDICIPTADYPIPSGTSEDCLFLDVYAPTGAASAGAKLPVFFWIQGGGFAADSNPNYNGSALIEASEKNIVIVTFNYRVGPYGFLAGEEVQEHASLNNGLKDQLKALEWVQKHISKFGGNPDHVVIGGDSAGGASVTLLLSAYGGRDDGLFHAAAAESQSFATMFNVTGSQFAYNNLAARTGCNTSKDSLACLRNLNVTALQKQNINTPFPGAPGSPLYLYGPTVDGDLVQDDTYKLFAEGKFIKVPVIFGDDTNEGTIFVPQSTNSTRDADAFIKDQFPAITHSQLATINKIYLNPWQTEPFPNAGIYWRPAATAYGEMRYICPGIDLSSIYAAAGLPSWNYHYAVLDPTSEREGYGVSHTIETNAIWGPDMVSGTPPASYYTINAPIIPVMQGYWTSFIRSMNPNTHRDPSTPEWETWGHGQDAYRRIFLRTNQTAMETVPMDQRQRCRFLTGIGGQLHQ